jgi:hypothetical protein
MGGGGSDHGLALTGGASAILKILQARPAILEKQLKRPGTSDNDHYGDDSSARKDMLLATRRLMDESVRVYSQNIQG